MRATVSLRLGAVLVIVTAMLHAAPCLGVQVPVPEEVLAARSSRIVLASVISSHSYWNADHTLIFTDFQVSIAQRLRGNQDAARSATVRVMGGEVDGVGLLVSDQPRLEVGSQYVLYLHELEQDTLEVTAGALGALRVAVGIIETTGESVDALTRRLQTLQK